MENKNLLSTKVRQLNSLKFIKYAIGCTFSVGIKIILTNIFVFTFTIPPQYAYIIVHIILVFYSFAYHTKITFANKISWPLFRDFCLSVIVFKILDYFLFLLGVNVLKGFLSQYLKGEYLGFAISGAVLLSTVFIFILRFVVYKKVLSKE